MLILRSERRFFFKAKGEILRPDEHERTQEERKGEKLRLFPSRTL